jgi:hypothetical protein
MDQVPAAETRVSEAQIALDRLRLKLEVAKEMAAEIERGSGAVANVAHVAAETPPANGDYRRLHASDAILRFVADHGPVPKKAILDALQDKIKTKSDKPRNIVRNCLIQLNERNRVAIDSAGNVSLKEADK